MLGVETRNATEELCHMVLAVPFRQMTDEVNDWIILWCGRREDVLLDVLAWRRIAADAVELCLTNNGVELLLGFY